MAGVEAEEVKRRVDIVEVGLWLGLPLRRKGKYFVCRCLYPERHRRGDRKAEHLCFDPVRQTYGCFACGYFGDAIDLVMRVRGVDFKQALEMLAEYAGISPPQRHNVTTPARRDSKAAQRRDAATLHTRPTPSPSPVITSTPGISSPKAPTATPPKAPHLPAQRRFDVTTPPSRDSAAVRRCDAVTLHCDPLHSALSSPIWRIYQTLLDLSPLSDQALEYLQSRGIQPEMALAARLGWIEDPAALLAELRRRFGDHLLAQAGLLSASGRLIFSRHRLIWPILWLLPPGQADDEPPEGPDAAAHAAGEPQAPSSPAAAAADSAQAPRQAPKAESPAAAGPPQAAQGPTSQSQAPGGPGEAPQMPRQGGQLAPDQRLPGRLQEPPMPGAVRLGEEEGEAVPIYLVGEAIGRRPEDAPKRLNLRRPIPAPFCAHLLFWAEPGEKVLICEGPVDTLLAVQAGYVAIGLPGAGAWRPEWARWLLPFEVYLALDPDPAGRRAAQRIASDLWRLGKTARRLPIPDGMDLADFLSQGA